MTIESELKKLTAAIEANTAAILSVGSNTPAPATSPAASSKPSTAKTKPAPETPAADEPAAEAPAIDKKTLTAKVIAYAKSQGREAAAALLAEFKATKVPELKESDYAAVAAKIDAVLED